MIKPGELTAAKLGILDEVAAKLATSTCGPVERACLTPGAPAWDQCECGLLAVYHELSWPTRDFPGPDLGRGPWTKCEPKLWVVRVVVTVLRCVPDGDPPACTDLEKAARCLDSDLEAIWSGIVCAVTGQFHAVQEATTVGPEGLCVGTAAAVLLGFKHCPPEC